MATITISAAGGNWNNTATWVGGVIPTTADDIVGDATSGNLVVNINATIRFANFSAYTGILTINSGFNLITNGTTTTETTFGTGMTITGGGFYSSGNGRIRSNGLTIPNLSFSVQSSTTTLMDDFNVVNLRQILDNLQKIVNAFTIYFTNFFVLPPAAGGANFSRQQGTTILYANGANCSWSGFSLNAPVGQTRDLSIANPIVIDTPGDFTITNEMRVAFSQSGAIGGITHISGNVIGDKNLITNNSAGPPPINAALKFDVSGITWDNIYLLTSSTSAASVGRIYRYDLVSDFNFDKMVIARNEIGLAGSVMRPILFSGGSLNGNSLSAYQFAGFNYPNTLLTDDTHYLELRFTTGSINNIGELNVSGTDTISTAKIKSNTAGVKATLNLTGNTQNVLFTDFTDIDASGGNTIYTYKGTISNSDNVLSVSTYVPTSSNTFLNG
jgi:hypothetical protein